MRSYFSKAFLVFTLMLMIFAILMAPTRATAQGSYVSTDRFGYTGTITRYDSFENLQANIGGTQYAVPQRDLGLYFVNGNQAFAGAGYSPKQSIFLTDWWDSPNDNGAGNPNNQNYGFLQHYDDDGGSVTSMSGVWTDQSMTAYAFSVSGGNGVYGCTSPGDCGRLWNAGSAPGSANATAGVFYQYDLNFIASGLTPATLDASTGVFLSMSHPTSVTGEINAIFNNQSSLYPESNGWYKLNAEINMTSWATTQGYIGNSYFGSSTATPEPASMTLIGSGLVGLAGMLRRRKHRQSLT